MSVAAAASSPKRWRRAGRDRKSTRLNSSHSQNSYAVLCLKKNKHAACVETELELLDVALAPESGGRDGFHRGIRCSDNPTPTRDNPRCLQSSRSTALTHAC